MAEGPAQRSDASPSGARDRWIVLALVLLAVALRAYELSASNLWLDEANSWQVATDSWGGLFTNVLRSPLGPLYFVVLKAWIAVFGTSVAALRALSLAASVALLPVIYALGARLLSRRAALVACALLALSPLELYFAQEARMYMLVSLLAAACVLAYAAWRDDRRTRRVVAYAACGIGLLFTHLVAGMLLVAINLDAAVVLFASRARARDRAWWAGANVLIAAVVLLYLASVSAGSAMSSQAWRSPMGIQGALRAALLLPFESVYGQHFYPADFWIAFTSLVHGSGFNRRFLELLVVQPLVLLVFVAVLVARPRERAQRGGRRLLALVLVVPVLAVTIVSVARGLEFPRYLLFVVPFLYLLLANGLLALGSRARAVSLAVLVVAMVIGERAERSVLSRDSDYRSTAALLLHEWQRDDRALIQPREMNAPLRYYLGARGPTVAGIAADGSLPDEARALAAHRTWVIIDYRSPLYELSPTEIADRFDAPITLDEYTTDATAGVRVLLLNVR